MYVSKKLIAKCLFMAMYMKLTQNSGPFRNILSLFWWDVYAECNLARQKEEDRDFIVSMQPQNSAGNWLHGCCEKRRIVSKSCAGNATCRKSHQNNWVLTWIFMCYSFIGYSTLLLRVHSLTFLLSIPRLISSLFASKYLMKWVNVWSAPPIEFICINWSEETQPIVAHWIVDVME